MNLKNLKNITAFLFIALMVLLFNAVFTHAWGDQLNGGTKEIFSGTNYFAHNYWFDVTWENNTSGYLGPKSKKTVAFHTGSIPVSYKSFGNASASKSNRILYRDFTAGSSAKKFSVSKVAGANSYTVSGRISYNVDTTDPGINNIKHNGNNSSINIKQTRIDSSGSLRYDITDSKWYTMNQTVSFTASCTDSQSGCTSGIVRNSFGPGVTKISSTDWTDRVGNHGYYTSTIKRDGIAPSNAWYRLSTTNCRVRFYPNSLFFCLLNW